MLLLTAVMGKQHEVWDPIVRTPAVEQRSQG